MTTNGPQKDADDGACPTCGRGGMGEPEEDLLSADAEDSDEPEKDGATPLRVPFAEMIRRRGGSA